jgi:hypothetical protein
MQTINSRSSIGLGFQELIIDELILDTKIDKIIEQNGSFSEL